MSHTFTAVIDIIGINPFVFIPEQILEAIFLAAGKNKGSVQVKGTVNKLPYKQNLVKYAGHWRLYINMQMLKNSPQQIGKKINISIEYDPADRNMPIHPVLLISLNRNKKAKKLYYEQSPSLQKEINRYISNLKTEDSINKNVKRAIDFLLGKERFVVLPAC